MNPLRVCFLVVALAAPAALTAQDADPTSEFATDFQVQLAGTVSSFEWSDPYCRMTVLVPLPDGRKVAWNLRLAPPAELKAKGWRSNSVKPGTEVELEVSPSLDGTTSGLVLAAKRSNGKPIGKVADI